MLPLPATRFELAVTSVVRVKLGLSKGSLFYLLEVLVLGVIMAMFVWRAMN